MDHHAYARNIESAQRAAQSMFALLGEPDNTEVTLSLEELMQAIGLATIMYDALLAAAAERA